MNVVDVDPVEEFLSHHGVRGQHWGIRNIRKNMSLNKASRAKDRKAQDKAIDKARSRTKGTTLPAKLGFGDKGSKSFNELKKAKHDYKHDKFQIGTREAKKALSKVRDKRIKDLTTAKLTKSGKERTIAILTAAGIVGIKALAAYAHEKNA